MGVPEVQGEEKGEKHVFKDIMAENFPMPL
jgi:hypothetical protein